MSNLTTNPVIDTFMQATTQAAARSAIAAQDLLVSGTNIKTINGTTILGSSDLVVSGSFTAASSAEIIAGTDNAKGITPAGLAAAGVQNLLPGTTTIIRQAFNHVTPMGGSSYAQNGAPVMGWSFIPSKAVTITALGREYLVNGVTPGFSGPTNSTNHNIRLYDETVSTTTPVLSATVLVASTSDAIGMKWVSVTPTALIVGHRYTICTDEGTEYYRNNNTGWSYLSIDKKFTGIQARWSSGGAGTCPTGSGGSNLTYTLNSFKFTDTIPAVSIQPSGENMGIGNGAALISTWVPSYAQVAPYLCLQPDTDDVSNKDILQIRQHDQTLNYWPVRTRITTHGAWFTNSNITAIGGNSLDFPNTDGVMIGSYPDVETAFQCWPGGTGIEAAFDVLTTNNLYQFRIWKDGTLKWGNSTKNGHDVGLSRLSAGVLAVGNGASGNTSGTIAAKIHKYTPSTVAGLGSAATAGDGASGYANDLTAITSGSTAVGGGSLKHLVISDGTNWIVQ